MLHALGIIALFAAVLFIGSIMDGAGLEACSHCGKLIERDELNHSGECKECEWL